MSRTDQRQRSKFAQATVPTGQIGEVTHRELTAEEIAAAGTDGTEDETLEGPPSIEWNDMESVPHQAKPIWVTDDLIEGTLVSWHQTRSFDRRAGKWVEDGHFVLAGTKLRYTKDPLGWAVDNNNWLQMPGENGGLQAVA